MNTTTVTVVLSDLSCRWTKLQNLKKDYTKQLQEDDLLMHNPTVERRVTSYYHDSKISRS